MGSHAGLLQRTLPLPSKVLSTLVSQAPVKDQQARKQRPASGTASHRSSAPPASGTPAAQPPAGRRPVPLATAAAVAMKRAGHVHDAINLALLPVIGVLTLAGLVGWIPAEVVTATFLVYVAGDFVWVALQVRG